MNEGANTLPPASEVTPPLNPFPSKYHLSCATLFPDHPPLPPTEPDGSRNHAD